MHHASASDGLTCRPHQWRYVGGKFICATCGAAGAILSRSDDGPAIARRFAGLASVEVEVGARTFDGYALRWGEANSYREIFERGAFAKTLASPPALLRGKKPSFYLQHDWNNVIGEWTDIREDAVGLFVRGRFIASPIGDHAMALVREKLVTGLSIGFVEVASRTEGRDDPANRVTYIEEADLYEISLVERASAPSAGVTELRAIRPDMTVREIEQVLAGLPGMPRDAAKAMAGRWRPKGAEERDAQGANGADLRDAGGNEDSSRDAAAMNRLLELMRS